MTMTSRAAFSAAALAASALLLAACGSDPEPAVEQTVDPYAAVSPEDAEDYDGDYEGSTPDEQASVIDADGPVGLSEAQFLEIMLDEDDVPQDPQQFSENTGTDYFHESMGVNQGRYTEGFGASECAAAMDAVNVDLIGEDPVEGAIREVSYEDDGASLVLWMLSYEEPAASGLVWDQLLAACEGSVLENETDTAEFFSLDHAGFSGMSMEMQLQGGSSADGHFATLDYGHNILMISALNLEEDVFLEVVGDQVQKLEEFEDAGS